MTIDRMHQEIKLRLNKLNSNHLKGLPNAYLDDAINKATLDYIEILYSGNNSKAIKFGFEVTQQRTDMLQSLVVPNEPLTVSTVISNSEYRCSLPTNYYHFIRAYAVSNSCPGKVLEVQLCRHNDLFLKLTNAHTKPDLTWGRVIGVIRGNNLDLYTSGFPINTVKLDYLRKPNRVFYSGYNTLESVPDGGHLSSDPKVHSDIPEAYHDLLVDFTVQYISNVLHDNSTAATQQNTILSKI